jgi:dephospho-CoA kinase
MSQFVVGLSGGIGSGKTTVTDLFAELAVDIIDADVIARQVVEPGTQALAKIVEKFGGQILGKDAYLDRAKLRELIFQQPLLKDWLNELLHPIIRQEMQRLTQEASSAYCILSVPLLFENKLNKSVDRVLIVDVSEQTQVTRTIGRDAVEQKQVKAIMASQASRAERLTIADDVIDNNGDEAALVGQVRRLHSDYLQQAKTAQAQS